MADKLFEFGFGKEKLKLSLPAEKILNEIEGRPAQAITDVPAAVREALRNPIDSAPLADIVKAGDKVGIVVSDITRGWIKSYQFLPTLVDELNLAGIPDEDIFIMISLGTHRKHTPEEDVAVCGKEICDRIAVYQHDGLDEDNLVYLGTTSRGTEAYINKKIVEADKVILTGGIVFHLMAGFGGGRKSIMPGVSGDKTIQGNHSIALHDEVGMGSNPLCASGKLEGNPLHDDMTEVAAMVKPDFLLNGVYTPEGDFYKIFAGHWYTAWEQGCQAVLDIYGIPIEEQADVVIASAGGFPKDINLYQGSKTIDNAFMAAKPGGIIVCILECPDIYEPPVFSSWFKYTDILEFENAVRADFSIPAFIAFKCADIAKKLTAIVVTKPENADFIKRTGMIPVTTLEEAWQLVENKMQGQEYKITIMAHAANTVPLLKK